MTEDRPHRHRRRAPEALLVVNQTAGSAGDERVEAAAALLRGAMRLTEVRTGGQGADAVREAMASFTGSRVIVAGGDGSLHVVVNALHTLGRLDAVTVGLVPLGTGNDLAGGVGLPADPLDAARVCVEGSPVAMDLVVADDGEVVVNAAHAGIGAVAAEHAQAAKPLAGPLAYPLGAVQAAASETGYRMTIAIDDRAVSDGDVLFALVANGPSMGGGTRMVPDADPTDGMLDVLAIDAVPVRERPGLGLAIQRGLLTARDDVRRWRGRRVTLTGDPVDHNRDGELRHGLRAATYTIHEAAWRLLR